MNAKHELWKTWQAAGVNPEQGREMFLAFQEYGRVGTWLSCCLRNMPFTVTQKITIHEALRRFDLWNKQNDAST